MNKDRLFKAAPKRKSVSNEMAWLRRGGLPQCEKPLDTNNSGVTLRNSDKKKKKGLFQGKTISLKYIQ